MKTTVHSVAARWNGGWDEAALGAWAEKLRHGLGPQKVTFGIIFATPSYFAHAREMLELIRVHAQAPVLAGCSTHSIIADGHEHEGEEGIALSLFALPEMSIRAFRIAPGDVDSTATARADGATADGVAGWIAFLEPFQTDSEHWIESWQAAFPGAPIFGGLATGRGNEPGAQVYCDGEVIDAGGVVLALSGVRLLGMVAQGCTPVGETWTITRVEGNIIHRIGNRPAFAVLQETFDQLTDESKSRSRGNFFAGLVVDEYREDFKRGDFVVRNLFAADPETGALAIGAQPRQGQTLQFQIRDAAAADQDIRELLAGLREDLGRSQIYGGCLSICNGRGRSLFGEKDHDAALVQHMLGANAITGFFCNGEFGPVGSKSFVHGYTASLVLFVGPSRSAEDEW